MLTERFLDVGEIIQAKNDGAHLYVEMVSSL